MPFSMGSDDRRFGCIRFEFTEREQVQTTFWGSLYLVLVPLCSRECKNVFQEHRKSVIPTEFKVLIALRILARAHDTDTMSE